MNASALLLLLCSLLAITVITTKSQEIVSISLDAAIHPGETALFRVRHYGYFIKSAKPLVWESSTSKTIVFILISILLVNISARIA